MLKPCLGSLLFLALALGGPALAQETDPDIEPAAETVESVESAEELPPSTATEAGLEGNIADTLEGYDPAAAFQGEVNPAVMSNASNLISAGGPVIIILALLAVLAIAVAVVKGVQFMLTGVGRTKFVRHAVDQIRKGHAEAAIVMLDETRAPVAAVMAAALRGKLDNEMSDDLVREETTRVAQANLDGLERGLALLRLIAETAPLLGLLGTVLGMIEAFQQMQMAGDRVEPGILAGGIWEALLTTAAGLTVALPAAAFHTWFSRTVEVETQHMEDASTQVFTLPLYPKGRPD